jgi:hypothetical protein
VHHGNAAFRLAEAANNSPDWLKADRIGRAASDLHYNKKAIHQKLKDNMENVRENAFGNNVEWSDPRVIKHIKTSQNPWDGIVLYNDKSETSPELINTPFQPHPLDHTEGQTGLEEGNNQIDVHGNCNHCVNNIGKALGMEHLSPMFQMEGGPNIVERMVDYSKNQGVTNEQSAYGDLPAAGSMNLAKAIKNKDVKANAIKAYRDHHVLEFGHDMHGTGMGPNGLPMHDEMGQRHRNAKYNIPGLTPKDKALATNGLNLMDQSVIKKGQNHPLDKEISAGGSCNHCSNLLYGNAVLPTMSQDQAIAQGSGTESTYAPSVNPKK